jgi:hypothetical protein
MINTLTAPMRSALNAMNRLFINVYTGGFAQFIQDILDVISNGEIGITSNAYDVDSLCLGGGAFSREADTTTGLTFGYFGGQFYNGSANVTTAAGTIALTASTTNYIEVDSAGTVHCTLGGFTPGRLPLYTNVTRPSSITTVANSKTLLMLLTKVTGAMLSATAASKSASKETGTLTATTTYLVQAPCTGTLAGMTILCPTGVAADNANYWTFSANNLGAAGAGTQPLLSATAINTTKTTGGSAVVSDVPWTMTLAGTSLAVVEGDVIQITATATGAPSALSGSLLRAKFTFTG